jgi:peptidoglycan-associated lipoprotein
MRGQQWWILNSVVVSMAALLVSACAKERVPTAGWATGAEPSRAADRDLAGDAGGADGLNAGAPGGTGAGWGDARPAGFDESGGASGRAGGGEGPGAGGAAGAESKAIFGGSTRPDPRSFTAAADLQDVHFEFDRYDIRPEDEQKLRANAAWLKSRPGDIVIIEGHCDERGTPEYNLALGEHRAKSTKNFLVAEGVDERRITIISYGELRPVCAERSEPCWATNRRSHFLVKSR